MKSVINTSAEPRPVFVSNALWRSLAVRLCSGLLPLVLAACGGGGGGGGDSSNPTPPPISAAPTPGTGLLASSTLAQRCAPDNVHAPGSSKTGSLTIEKQWVRSYVDEAYLWPDEVPTVDANAADYSGSDVAKALDNYFEALKSPRLTDSGARRDQFSFTMPTAEWKARSESGVEGGYGIEWSLGARKPPRRIRIASVEPGSPAAVAGLQRGDEVKFVDGVSADVADALGVDRLNEALLPTALNVPHAFSFSRPGTGTFSQTLISASVAKTPVPLRQVLTAADGARVGYVLFNDHILPAEAQLIEAFNYLKSQSVTDLVLDLRYNGGGYLFIASELAYMIAGQARVGSQVFERLSYNSKRTAQANNTPFYNTSCLLVSNKCTSQQPLPSLNLTRVFVLTQSGTCSASESVINGLRGVGVEVIQIGGKTCGKPYGFTAKDNCGISYFPIEFVGANAQGFGDYSDGFEPVAAVLSSGRKLPGCVVDDDFAHALGDSAEAMLAGAMRYRSTGVCPPLTGTSASLRKAQAALLGEGEGAGEGAVPLDLKRSLTRDNRIVGGR